MRRVIVHPVLIACFPVAHLYAHNAHFALPGEVVVPLAASVFAALAIWGLLLPVFRNVPAAALATSWFILLFHSYGRIVLLVQGASIGTFVIGRSRYLIPLWLALLAAGSFYAWRSRGKPRLAGITFHANLFSAAMVLISVAQIAYFELGGAMDGKKAGAAAAAAADSDSSFIIRPQTRDDSARQAPMPGPLPDIYYIIPDSYVADSTLKNSFGYDNREFTDFLKEKGFFVASKSLSNYAFTALSLPSSMNMEMLDVLGEKLGADSRDKSILTRMMMENKVMAFLKSRGYTLINAGSWWGPTFQNKNADINLRSSHLNEFTLNLLEGSALYPFMEEFTAADMRKKILYTFDKLAEIPAIEAPTFTFAHIICPHPPYVFGPDGEEISTFRRVTSKTDSRRLYLDQVLFTNKKLKETVEKILDRSETTPIIIIQGDHGAAYIRNTLSLVDFLPDERYLKDQMRIYNAYLLPGPGAEVLYDSITPVNTFRVVFNAYFGTDLPLLEDRSVYSSQSQPYRFTDVTGQVDYDD